MYGSSVKLLSSELTDQGLPLAIGLGDLVHTAHLAVRHPPDDEDNDPGPRLHLSGASVLVPVTIASTRCETRTEISVYCKTSKGRIFFPL